MTRLEFLNDTITYYSENVDRRCTYEHGCFYSPINSDKQGISEGCAIGRHLDSELQLRLDKDSIGDSGVSNDEVFESLPTWLQELGQDFLVSIQILHDRKENWDSKGLSEIGKEHVNNIITKYDI